MSPKAIRYYPPLLSSLAFILAGISFIPQAGIQNDEALFAGGIYQQSGLAQVVKIGGHRIPLMLMSYLGTLKAWLYAPIFRLWKPSAASLRLPVILIGGLTIWLFWSLTRRIAGERAAAVAAVLLASDTLYLITGCFDWGPVALQHLLLVSGALCLVRFHVEKRRGFLPGGFFLFGLALWDKALFAWIFSGIAIAGLAVLFLEIRKHLNLRNLLVAVGSFCAGAAPLIYYNICYPLDTFHSNAAYAADDVPGKSRMLLSAFSGSGLLGYIPRNDAAGHPRQPQGVLENISIKLSDFTSHQQDGPFGWALLGALFLLPFLWRTPARRPMVFSLLATAIAWVQMLFAKGAGGSVHHAILLWPFPALFAAVAFAEASRKLGRRGLPVLGAFTAFLAGANALVTNEYFARLVRNGPTESWTDAVTPLSDYLRHVKPGTTIYVNDWGIFDTVRMLSRGKLTLRVGSDPLSKPQLDAEDRRVVQARLAEPEVIFVSHTDAAEQFTGVNGKLRDLAREGGYRRVNLAEIPDRNGRPIFEVFRFEPQ
ncbi:MAG TPA: glycosyltransferase family 39 protein [Bryobacteraceae bacterium]|nr:glycosyltransferase family 39 protein [Bryobacteraceae bacterium]